MVLREILFIKSIVTVIVYKKTSFKTKLTKIKILFEIIFIFAHT